MKMRTMGVAALAAAAVLAVSGVVALAGASSDARTSLNGYREVPAISTSGSGSFWADIDRGKVRYRLSYGHLEGGDVLFAHIHLGKPATNGGVVAFLCGGGGKPTCPASGTVEGVITADDVVGPAAQGIAPGEFAELARAIRRNATYVNVHTEAYPTGEVRGNLVSP
jgi:hypothetical protein